MNAVNLTPPGLVRIDPDAYDSLGELLDDALIAHKSETFLIEVDRQRETARYDFLAFRRLAARVTRRLELSGIGPDDRVAILMTNQSKWLVSAFAVWARGAVLVPLDHKLAPDEVAALLAHADPKLLITEYGLWKRLPAGAASATWVTEAPDAAALPEGVVRWEALPDAIPGPPVRRRRTDQASLVYSSGTGGTPKGCQLSHGAYLAQLAALLEVFPMAPGDRFFSILPTNHAIDLMCGFVGPLVCGATVVHQRTLRPELIRATMKSHAITHLAVVPLLLSAFENAIREKLDDLDGWKRSAFDALRAVNAAVTRKRPNHAVSSRLLGAVHDAFGGSLRVMFCGGAPTDRASAEFFYDLGIPVVIGYGLTEACTVATVHRMAPYRADGVGKPVRGVEVRIDRPGPDGVGEVLLRGPTLMDGYRDAPELTAETIRDGWLYTGDLGRLDASDHLHLVGRSKNMIVTAGGKNVYPEDVEQALGPVGAEELCVFAATYLFPRDRLEYGELLAVVRPKDGDSRWLDALRARNRGLPEHKRLAGVLVWDKAFPRTASMKVKRAVLAEALREGLDRSAVRPLLDVVGT